MRIRIRPLDKRVCPMAPSVTIRDAPWTVWNECLGWSRDRAAEWRYARDVIPLRARMADNACVRPRLPSTSTTYRALPAPATPLPAISRAVRDSSTRSAARRNFPMPRRGRAINFHSFKCVLTTDSV